METVRRKYDSLRGRVYEFLREELARGSLVPGQGIDLDATALRLGVSRTPLREALLILDAEGFVKVLPRSGITITPLSLDDIRELYGVIGALEGSVIARAAGRLGREALDRMAALDAQMSDALDAGDSDAFYARNLAYHGEFLACADNARLVRSVDLAKRRLYDFPKRTGLLAEWERASIREHERIVEFLRNGDFRAAGEYMRDVHWSFEAQRTFILRYYYGTGETA